MWGLGFLGVNIMPSQRCFCSVNMFPRKYEIAIPKHRKFLLHKRESEKKRTREWDTIFLSLEMQGEENGRGMVLGCPIRILWWARNGIDWTKSSECRMCLKDIKGPLLMWLLINLHILKQKWWLQGNHHNIQTPWLLMFFSDKQNFRHVELQFSLAGN